MKWWKVVLFAMLGGLIGSVLVGIVMAVWNGHQTPPNTDPRKGRVILYDPGWGNPRDWKECADTTLIISIQGVENGDRYIDDSPECQP